MLVSLVRTSSSRSQPSTSTSTSAITPAHPQLLCPSRFLLLHIKTMDAHQKTFPFLSLPPELRVMVYKFVFEDQTQLPRSHSLRNVSHLVHDEATPLALRCMIMVVYKSISGDQTVLTCRPVYHVTPIPSNSIISWRNSATITLA